MKIDVMTDAQLVDYLNTLVFEMNRDLTELALIECTQNTGQPCAGTEGASIYIQPEWGMNRRNHLSIPDEGVVVARIINLDPNGRTDTRYGFPAQQRSWWYVDKDPAGNLRSRYFTRTHNATGPAVRFLGPPRPFTYCGHDPQTGPAMAKWRDCNTRFTAWSGVHTPGLTGVSFLPASFRATSSASNRMAVAADTWVSCMANCCTG